MKGKSKMIEQHLISAEEASQILHHHKKYIYKLREQGELEGYKVKGKWFFLRRDVEKLGDIPKNIIRNTEKNLSDIVNVKYSESDTEYFDRLIKYAAKLSMLNRLKKEKYLTENEYERIKNKIKKVHKIKQI